MDAIGAAKYEIADDAREVLPLRTLYGVLEVYEFVVNAQAQRTRLSARR